MTWFASGNAVGLMGTDLDEDGAVRGAFNGLFSDLGVLLGDNVTLPAVERAIARWSGEGDDFTEPFLSRGADPRRRSRLHLDIGGERVRADSAFAAFAMRPGADEVSITFVDDGQLSANTAATTAMADYPLRPQVLLGGEEEIYVLVDAFVGAGTTRQTALAKLNNGIAHVRLRLRGRVAVLLGTRIRVAGESRAARDRDSSWTDRLSELERAPEHAHLAVKHPRIRQATQGPSPIAVLVHGTFSSCVPVLAEVSDEVGEVPLYRFEHDTMRPVAENARELVAELTRVGSSKVTLLGHSRGGLVATVAAAHLQTVTKVLTFGTPHRGTPVVSSLDNLLGYAAASAGVQLKSILDGGLAAAHFGSTLPYGHLPDGWTDMLPHGSFIQALSLIDRSAVVAYGGVFDGSKPQLGIGPTFGSQVATALMEGDNDLVVHIESSKPDELDGEILDQVDHFSYFRDQKVKTAIKEALHPPPPSPPAPGRPNPWHA